MLRTFLTIVGTALSLLVVDIIFPGVRVANFPAALIAGVVIGLLNSSVKPALLNFSVPFNTLTLTASSLVINGICFWLASILVPGFRVAGILAFILGPVILSAVNTFLSTYLGEKYPQLATTANSVEELADRNVEQLTGK